MRASNYEAWFRMLELELHSSTLEAMSFLDTTWYFLRKRKCLFLLFLVFVALAGVMFRQQVPVVKLSTIAIVQDEDIPTTPTNIYAPTIVTNISSLSVTNSSHNLVYSRPTEKPVSKACAYYLYRTQKPLTWRNQQGLVTTVSPLVSANCQKLQVGSTSEINRVEGFLKYWRNDVSDKEFYQNLKHCSYIKSIFSANNFYISDMERDFPLAYAMLFYNSPQQIVRLLKVIYRPHNIYCLHPDSKASKQLIQAFRHLASCLDNVFVPRQLVKVTYMHFSMVEAQMLCMRELSTTYKHWQWKYAMILCGKELPFSTNRVIVESLQSLKGASLVDVHGIPVEDYWERFNYFYKVSRQRGILYRDGKRTDHLPEDILIYKSSNYISASRKFIRFLLEDRQVLGIYRFMSTARMADEEFYVTSYMLKTAPKGNSNIGFETGIGKGARGMIMAKTFFRYKDSIKRSGKLNHFSFILNIRDLPMLSTLGSKSTYFFFNKYFMDYDHVVMDCMERRIVQQNQLEYQRDCLTS